MKITLLGAGAWGTALAIAFAGKHAVTLWSRETDVAEDLRLNRENHRFFPGYRLPDAVVVSTDFAAAVVDAELLVVATPIAGLRPTVEHLKALGCKTPVLWVCKGFEAGSGKLPHQVVGEVLGKDALCGALSGPSFAEEVAAGQPTAVSLAANDAAFAREAARQLHSVRLRIYANDDLVGVEVGGAVERDPATDLLTVNREFTVSLVLARCQMLDNGRRRWKVRFDTSLAPDITVAVRLDQTNQAPLDYYLLPRLDFGAPRISLAEHNGIEFESYRFDSLDYLHGMAERTRVRRAA